MSATSHLPPLVAIAYWGEGACGEPTELIGRMAQSHHFTFRIDGFGLRCGDLKCVYGTEYRHDPAIGMVKTKDTLEIPWRLVRIVGEMAE